MNGQLWTYLRRDKKRVAGWLQRVDAEIMGAIFDYQESRNIAGGCVEIGVHHGKSFIPICMALRDGEKALCIDIFEDQSRNLDLSGRGNSQAFQVNLAKFGVNASRVRVFKGSSEDVTPEYVREQVGPVRYFSIDGGHWKSIVQNDLRLAEQTLAPGGVIALDDYCRAQWPEVTLGYSLWQESTTSDIAAFASGSNKLYLCRREFAPAYRAALKTNFLRHYLRKSYESDATVMDCYRVEPSLQDEDTLRNAFRTMCQIFRPDFFMTFNR
jgi:hypothetical protein